MNHSAEQIANSYRDPSLPTERRVTDLLSCMTLEEKLAQMGSVWVFQLLPGDDAFNELLSQGIGHVTRLAGASSLEPTEAALLANRIQTYLTGHTRLGIPAIIHEECNSGYMARSATCFPQMIGVASTWNPDLAEQIGDVVRVQMRAVGAHQGLSPVLDIARDPRWGRIEETFGEDPYLVSRMGVAFVKGLQGESLAVGVSATSKHFVGYGAPDGGLNWGPAHIPARELREVFLLPFEAAVKEAHLHSVMNAYHELDGVPCGASRELLTDILRDEWGFDGVVVSDYFSIDQFEQTHFISPDKETSAHLALEAGIDVELPSTDCYGEPLKGALDRGEIDMALIDRSVRRILTMKFEMGLFENPFVEAEQAAAVFDTPAQRGLARQIAQQSIVLLKNEGETLPLRKDLRSIAVIGPNADDVRNLIGDYAYPCHVESLAEMRERGTSFNLPMPPSMELADNFVPIRSILEEIRDKVSPDTTIHAVKGCEVKGESLNEIAEAVEAARGADVALVIVGGKSGLTDSCTTGEALDRVELGLPGMQLDLLKAVYETGTPVVVVLVNGRPLSLPWIVEHVPAVLETWLPGEEGGRAVADALFGDTNPGGKLPVTIPAHVGQVPIVHYVKPSGGKSFWKETYVDCSNEPLFPFGFGLSYTTFALDNLRLSAEEVSIGEELIVEVDVTNTGSRAGDEVVQLYTGQTFASVTRPVQELRGFLRVALEPGETKTVSFTLHTHQLAFYDRDMRYVVEPGVVAVMLGTSSADLPLAGSVSLLGPAQEVGGDKVFSSRVGVVE
jgi:beta-glucosidase